MAGRVDATARRQPASPCDGHRRPDAADHDVAEVSRLAQARLPAGVQLEEREERHCSLEAVPRRDGGERELTLVVEDEPQAAEFLHEGHREVGEVTRVGHRRLAQQAA